MELLCVGSEGEGVLLFDSFNAMGYWCEGVYMTEAFMCRFP